MTTVKISPTGDATAEVTIDGTDIADAVRGLTLTMAPDRRPRLIVDLNVFVEPIEAADAQIVVPAQTVKALEALGWKSPGEAKALETVVRTMVAEEIEAAHAKDPSCPDCCLPTAAAIAREATR